MSDRRLSAKLVQTFADRGESRSQRGGSPTAELPFTFKTLKLSVASRGAQYTV
jgi:hypothetical protein